MKHKTQVFFSPNNDHVCTRIEHSLHVATIAKTICHGLGLNGELGYAIGLCHDLGHAPFGHSGEEVLGGRTKEIGGFVHELHGLRIVDVLGNRGVPLNLTYGVRDGIICHDGESFDQKLAPRSVDFDLGLINKKGILPSSQEGCVTRMADRIAYVGRDLEDAIYAKFISVQDIPSRIRRELGTTNGEIIDKLVIDVIDSSHTNGNVFMSDSKYDVLMRLHEFSVQRIYKHDKLDHYRLYCGRIINWLFDYLMNSMNRYGWEANDYLASLNPFDQRFGKYLRQMQELYNEKVTYVEVVRDYIAGMTDDYALRCVRESLLPEELDFG